MPTSRGGGRPPSPNPPPQKAVDIWCEGEVVGIANGTTDKENPENAKCKKLAKAGAVRVRWPEDLDREADSTGISKTGQKCCTAYLCVF